LWKHLYIIFRCYPLMTCIVIKCFTEIVIISWYNFNLLTFCNYLTDRNTAVLAIKYHLLTIYLYNVAWLISLLTWYFNYTSGKHYVNITQAVVNFTVILFLSYYKTWNKMKSLLHFFSVKMPVLTNSFPLSSSKSLRM